ncbi:MAG: hypothetical protein K9H61_03770 [Bacteroidia bacterium]|nr:hypothetical protein [Bacteroidia bacterium]MCF8446092.1 hypothetical protein [Bacteroidia bacterium]
MVIENLVRRNYICVDWSQLIVAANRYANWNMIIKPLIFLNFLFLGINLFGQTIDSSYFDTDPSFRIDSISNLIDHCKKCKTKYIDTTLISIIKGQKINSISKITLKKISKYTLTTENFEDGILNVKMIEMYFYNDSLIKTLVSYGKDKDPWTAYYFLDNKLVYITWPQCFRVTLNDEGMEYLNLAIVLSTR